MWGAYAKRYGEARTMTTEQRHEVSQSLERLEEALRGAEAAAHAVWEAAERNDVGAHNPNVVAIAHYMADLLEPHSANRRLRLQDLRDAWSEACRAANAAKLAHRAERLAGMEAWRESRTKGAQP